MFFVQYNNKYTVKARAFQRLKSNSAMTSLHKTHQSDFTKFKSETLKINCQWFVQWTNVHCWRCKSWKKKTIIYILIFSGALLKYKVEWRVPVIIIKSITVCKMLYSISLAFHYYYIFSKIRHWSIYDTQSIKMTQINATVSLVS